jgi:hypothetical protein
MAARLIYEDDNFKILYKRDYIVARKGHAHEFHSHFKTLQGAHILIELFNNNLLPRKPYFMLAMCRICTEEEFQSLRLEPFKQKYKNKCRGRKR